MVFATMRHTYFAVLIHITFSTRQRQKTIAPEIRSDLHAYLGGIANHLDCTPINVGGVDDHVHLLLSTPPTIDIATLTEKLKSNSSRWAHDRGWKNLWWRADMARSASVPP